MSYYGKASVFCSNQHIVAQREFLITDSESSSSNDGVYLSGSEDDSDGDENDDTDDSNDDDGNTDDADHDDDDADRTDDSDDDDCDSSYDSVEGDELETVSLESEDNLPCSLNVVRGDTGTQELSLETVLGLALTTTGETKDDKNHHAVLTCFLQDDTGKVYGLTCGHVVQSSDGTILDHNGDEFGNCLTLKQNVKLQPDVGVFEVCDTSNSALFGNRTYDDRGVLKPCQMFKGTVRKLYSRHVYKGLPVSNRESGLTDKGTTIVGRIASEEVHNEHRDILKEDSFLTCSVTKNEQNEDVECFSVPGESGTPLCLSTDSDIVSIVGSITGVMVLSETTNITAQYVICAFLPSAIKSLEREHNMTFHFPIHRLENNTQNKTHACNLPIDGPETIMCGGYIFLKTMEKVSPSDFDISERLWFMTALNFDHEPYAYMPLICKYEASLRHTVFSRGSINFSAIFYPDSAEQRSMLLGYLCVQALYAGHFKEGKVLLKAALTTLANVQDSSIHILSKCITFATFLYFSTKENDKARRTFKAGLDFYESNKHHPNFPKDSYGFLYYNYSKYFLRKGNRDKAVEMGFRCHDIVKSVYEQKLKLADADSEDIATRANAKDFYNRYLVAVCKLTNTLLWCGETFQKKYREFNVPSEDVETSEALLRSIASGVTSAPAVQKVEYLLSRCNLFYRQQDYKRALACANRCMDMSRQNNLNNELFLAQRRKRVLDRMIGPDC